MKHTMDDAIHWCIVLKWQLKMLNNNVGSVLATAHSNFITTLFVPPLKYISAEPHIL